MRRWAAVVGAVALGGLACSHANPDFSAADTDSGSTGGPTGPGTAASMSGSGASTSSGATMSASGTNSGTSTSTGDSTTDASTGYDVTTGDDVDSTGERDPETYILFEIMFSISGDFAELNGQDAAVGECNESAGIWGLTCDVLIPVLIFDGVGWGGWAGDFSVEAEREVVDMSGVLIQPTVTDLFTAELSQPINAFNVMQSSNNLVWTGYDGEMNQVANCGSWTISGDQTAGVGLVNTTNAGWPNGDVQSCNTNHTFLCLCG